MALERKRETMPWASLTMSAVSDSGRSGWGVMSSLSASSWGVVVSLAVEAVASPAWTERLRAWVMRLETPAVASLYCLLVVAVS